MIAHVNEWFLESSCNLILQHRGCKPCPASVGLDACVARVLVWSWSGRALEGPSLARQRPRPDGKKAGVDQPGPHCGFERAHYPAFLKPGEHACNMGEHLSCNMGEHLSERLRVQGMRIRN